MGTPTDPGPSGSARVSKCVSVPFSGTPKCQCAIFWDPQVSVCHCSGPQVSVC
ncbi:unnamed protein product, partial [Staurois parvus]